MSERAEASTTDFWKDADETEALQRYRTLVNAIDDGIYQLDADGRFVAVNEIIVELSGYAREELLGEHVSLLLDEDDVAAIERDIARRLAGGDDQRTTYEFPVRTADGDWIPCELRLNLLVEDGRFRGTIGVVRDVSERKRTERELGEREQELDERERQLERERDLTDEVLEASPVGMMVLDGDGTVKRTNGRAREILGISDDERARYSPADRPTYDESGRPIPVDEHPFAQALETGEPVYDRVLQVERPNGERRWLSVNAEPILTDDGEVDRVVTTGEDVTEIKERERELESELSEVFGRVTDAFYALDADWQFTHVNERAEELIDYRDEGLLGENFWEVFEWATDSKLGEEYRTAMETQEPTSFEFYYPEPLEAWYEVHAYPSETGLSVYFRDVTHSKEREQALQERERQLSTLMENVPGMVYRCLNERGWPMKFVSDACRDLTGHDPDALERGEIVWGEDVIVAADRERVWEELQTAVTDREPFSITYRIETTDGELRWVRDYGRGVFDDEGDLIALEGIISDVTDRKRLEAELRESEHRYRTLVENFPNGAVALVDEEFRYRTVGGSPIVADATVDDLEAEPVEEALPPELADQFVPRYEAAFEGESSTFEAEFADRIYRVHVLPVRDDDGEIFAALGMSQDVTERKERERELEEYHRKLVESERRYRALAEHFPNGIVTLFDHDLEYTLAAGKGFEDIPVEPADLEGEHYRDAWSEDTADALEPSFEAALDGQERSVELEYAGREWVVHAVPITDERGDVFAGMTMAQDITEQKERERYLREAKSQLEAATEAGAVGTWEWHIPEDEFVAGTSFARTFGVDPDAAREGVSLDRVVSSIHEADRERVEREIEATIEACDEYEEEYRVWNADGELRWVVARGHVECDDEGNPVRFPGALTDITERKLAEKELEAQRKQLETLFEVLPVGVVVADGDGNIIESNESAKEIWGVDAFDAETVTDYEHYRGWWADTGEPIDSEEWTLARVLRGEEVTEPDVFEIEAADGEHRIVMVHGMPIREANGEVTRAVATLTDITDRREYQRQLEESERRYRTLAEHFPNGAVSVFDEDLRIELTQGSVLGETLPSRDQIEGRTIAEVYPEYIVEDLAPLLRAAVEDGVTGSDTYELGEHNWQVWATPLRDASGEIFAGLSFAQDITEQVEREQQLEETVEKLEESNERLESFASMLAHELRNPVTIGQIYTQQLPDETDSEAVEYVTEAFDRIEDMIDVMLVLTRGREAVGESNPLSLADVASDAWEGVDAPDASLLVDVDEVIEADETYVRHLFRNLFDNAVQHGGSGVTVEVGGLPDENGFYVADDGAGIPADDRDTVFEAGFTTAASEGGTGLGLAFVRELAEVYEWDYAVTESETGGARFEFRNVYSAAAE